MDENWAPNWISEWESYDCSFLQQGELINPMDSELFPIEESLHEYFLRDDHQIEISERHSPKDDESEFKRPAKRHTSSLRSPMLDNIVSNQQQLQQASSSSSSYMLSFQNQLYTPESFVFQVPTLTPVFFESSTQLPKVEQVSSSSNTRDCELGKKANLARLDSSRRRTPVRGKDHIIAERKRRERITQMLIQLSALVPGLKKLDQRSVLFHAIQYVKQLQERVKLLDEKTKKITVESVVLRQKPNACADKEAMDASSSCTTYIENYSDPLHNEKTLPEVQARVSARDVLIRIQCKRLKGQVANILREIENQHLVVINSIVLPFGTALLEIIIIAQMEDGFCTTVKELAKSLRQMSLP